MISSDTVRGYNDIMILFLLLEKSSYGYEISKKITELSEGEYVIKETTLYSAFNRLEKNNYIESFPGTKTNGKKRIYYRITDLGISYYDEKYEEWQLAKKIIEKFIKKV